MVLYNAVFGIGYPNKLFSLFYRTARNDEFPAREVLSGSLKNNFYLIFYK
ncbi:MAG: hypothetical protein IKI11_02370 [Neisseriaceae bacterium]|nr:hypothetical protein [Neisseriaceae bacterium]